MMSPFDQFRRGDDCPSARRGPIQNEHWDLVVKFQISARLFSSSQTYRGQCQLGSSMQRHASRQTSSRQKEWCVVLCGFVGRKRHVVRTVKPDHVNIESLGNVVPHLHWHIVPRYGTIRVGVRRFG